MLPQGIGAENEKRLALIHGAAAVAYHLLCSDMVELSFATIVARESNAEGQVAIAENPVALRPGVFTKGFMRRHMRSCLIPSVTEEIFYGFDNCTKVTAPYSGRAREIANFFVNNCAMSDEDSELSYMPTGQVIEVNDFLRSDRIEYMLPSTTLDRYKRADEETRRLLENQYAAAKRFVLKQRPAIEAVRDAILEKRTVQAEELKAIIDKHAVAPFDDEQFPSGKASDRKPFNEWNGSKPADYVTGRGAPQEQE
jgi:cell division protease FtsH